MGDLAGISGDGSFCPTSVGAAQLGLLGAHPAHIWGWRRRQAGGGGALSLLSLPFKPANLTEKQIMTRIGGFSRVVMVLHSG